MVQAYRPDDDHDVVGRRLSVVLSEHRKCPATVVAYFPKTKKHRLRFDAGHEERSVRLRDLDVCWKPQPQEVNDDVIKKQPQQPLSSWELALRRDVVGRRIEVFHHVRHKWYQGTVQKYVEHCQEHTLLLDAPGRGNGGGGKVHLVDLTQCPWRYTDLIGPLSYSQKHHRNPSDLATSKYMGVVRHTEGTWKAYYYFYDYHGESLKSNSSSSKYLGCFALEKDAALAYDVYARKHNTPVNFSNRRICRAELKRLCIPEPPADILEETVSIPLVNTSASPPPTTTTTKTLASSEPVVVESTAAQPVETSTTTTTTTVIPATSARPNNDNRTSLPAPKKLRLPQQQREQQQQSGRVTPSSVTEETGKHDNDRSNVKVAEDDDDGDDDEEDEAVDKLACGGEQRRLSVGSEDRSVHKDKVASSVRVATSIHKNIFEDSEDEDECEFKDSNVKQHENHGNSTAVHHAPTTRHGMAHNIFDSDSDDDDHKPGHVTPPQKSRKNACKKKERSKSSIHRRRLRVIEETFSSEDEEDDLNSLEDRYPRHHVPTKKLKTRVTAGSPSNKSKRAASPARSKYPVGTRFMKKFPGYGTFEGEITFYDGRHYHVYYPADEDEEELSEYEFEEYEILTTDETCGKEHVSSKASTKRKKDGHGKQFKRRRTILDGC